MADEPKYVLVSPDGNEYPTSDETYRHSLLAQGYKEKNPKRGNEPGPGRVSAQPENQAPQRQPQPPRAKPEHPDPKTDT